MTWVRGLVAVVLGLGMWLPTALAERKPVVVIFNIETKNLKMSKSQREALSDYLANKLTETGMVQVVPRDQLKKRLLGQKHNSYKACYDQTCQIEIGRELAAEKTLSTKILKLGTKCTVALSLYDLRKATAEAASTVKGKCKMDDIVESIDKAVDNLNETSKRATEELAKKAEDERKAREAEVAKKAEDERKAREAAKRFEAEKKVAEEKARLEKLAREKDVRQPGTNLFWLRCPMGQMWNGETCEGKAKYYKWDACMKACPSGYRLPTRQEFVALLGGCDANVRGGDKGECNSCSKSPNCSSMLADIIHDAGRHWSSTSSPQAFNKPSAWYAHFKLGLIHYSVKGCIYHARCLRDGF